MEHKNIFTPVTFPGANDANRFNPGVRHWKDDEVESTRIWEYNLYDRRDAEILADVLAKAERDIYERTIKNELQRMKNRVSRTK